MYASYFKSRGFKWVAVLTVAAWCGIALAQEPKPAKEKNLVQVAKKAEDLKTFNRLLELSGLVETFEGDAMYTIFAPSDAAFEKLGKEKLADLEKPENKAQLVRILKHHVLEGKHAAEDVGKMKAATTLAGQVVKITLEEGVVLVDGSKVTKTDIKASNGMIHMVDTVLMPKEEK